MLAVTLVMTYETTRAVMPKANFHQALLEAAPPGAGSAAATGAAKVEGTQPPASTSVGVSQGAAAAASAAERARDDGTSNSVANAMTAVGTAVAAVTLILSVGTTWFALKLKEVDGLTAGLRKKDETYGRALEAIRAERDERERVGDLLESARIALRHWVDQRSAVSQRHSHYSNLAAHLGMLQSKSEERRLNAFAELIKYLPARSGTLLQPVEQYSFACHVLHGGEDNTHGLWCRVFSEVERAAYVERTRPEVFH
jgi:pimeloyl-ACP methyl ester carboxylesterase